jgi:alkylation response protein AidB-like acyl-CoA dehydrogenase
VIFGTQGPDTGNTEILAAYGTDEQKERSLWPPFRQDIWSAFSMTEPEGGSDPSQFRTRAVLDGRDVLSGYEPHVGVWPTSYAPTRFAAAREKYASVLAHDPELAAAADAVERDLFARG